MAVYIVSFVLSCFLLKISESYKKSKGISAIFVFFAIMVPCLVAGLRLYSIGTDTNGYVKPMFRLAINADNYMRYLKLSWTNAVNRIRYIKDFEMGFSLLVYIIAKCTKNFQILLFVVHILIVVPIYRGLKKFKTLENSYWLSMLIFYLMFFNTSLNLIRQYIGIAIVFWGTSCLLNEENGKLKFFISIVIASLFHMASILGIIFFVMYLMLGYNQKEKKILKTTQYIFSLNTVILVLLVIFSIVIINNSSLIAKILSILNLEYYGHYINGKIKFVFSAIIEMVPILFLIMIVGKKFFKKYKNSYFLAINYIINYFIAQLSSINIYAPRIGHIFSIFNIVFFPELIRCFDEKVYRTIITMLLIIYMFIFWYYNFVFLGRNGTIPYVFYNYMK